MHSPKNMGDESDVTSFKLIQMGADNNPSSTSRLATLQTRKQALEERITAKNKELRRLCIQEAELTGVMPPEIPLEPGEILPTFRRRIGTAFEYPQNVVNSLSNEDETVPALETKIQVQKKIAEAALQLANNATISKSIRRKNMSLYRQTKQQLDFLEERLKTVKGKPASSNLQTQQLKQKKKPRPLLEADNISTKSSNPSQSEESNLNRNFAQPVLHRDQNRNADRYLLSNKYAFSNTNSFLSEDDLHNAEIQNFHASDDNLIPPLSKLSLNSYVNSTDRSSIEENSNSQHVQPSYSHSSPNIYQHQQLLIPNSQTLPHMSPNQYQRTVAINHGNFPSHSHTLAYPNVRIRCHSEESSRKYPNDVYRISYNQDYSYYPNSYNIMHLSPQNYKHLAYIEPNHILSHQQYEPEMSSAGLGGHWVKMENGDMIWCSTLHDDVANGWHTDKGFGSLDRRKAKHIRNKRTSPNLDMVNKQATMTMRSAVNPQDIPRPMTLQAVPSTTRSERHDRQLVRTQSLGSVGAQTVDSVWPSDDNSSYDSDGHSINELNTATRKLKQKGWCETSLDSPATVHNIQEEPCSPPQIPISSPGILSPSHLSVRTPRPILEIPAESNPSPMHVETNIEMLNNTMLTDLPKNCTVVQAGQCKPYREVTKPFEMSDFYKYSTKFRERNNEKLVKNENLNEVPKNQNFGTPPRNGVDNCQEDLYQKGVYQPLQPMKCQPLNSSNSSFNRCYGNMNSPCGENLNSSVDSNLGLNSSSVAVAEHFSAEMNAWYQTHSHTEPRIDNNNSSTSPVPLGRSTATLV